jgi:HAD superfamily hydrolase (TIGR01509 family)
VVIADPVSLDELAGRWRVAFAVAADALQAASRCNESLGFAEHELAQHKGRLAHDREAAARLLTLIAHDEHVVLHRSVLAPRATRPMVGLPPEVLACVFDLEGVLTGSASIHAAAWADAFDEFLARRLEQLGERFAAFRPFNPQTDYDKYLHGKPRLEGVHSVLAGRGIRLPEGHVDDAPGTETVHGLANRKNEALLRRLDREGVSAYADTRQYLEAAREAGLLLAAVSASANTAAILERAGLDALIAERVDGNTIRAERLRSKPAPDALLTACRRLGVPPARAAAFETTDAGIAAAHAAGFGFVVGVDRPDRREKLDLRNVDVVVTDLVALLDPALVVLIPSTCGPNHLPWVRSGSAVPPMWLSSLLAEGPGIRTEGDTMVGEKRADVGELGRKVIVKDVVELLREADVEFELLPHRRTQTATSEARALGELQQEVAKTVIVRADGGCVRAVIPASRRLSLERLGEVLGAEPMILTEAELDGSYPQFELGAVPPIGGPEGDRVVVDTTLAEREHVVFEAGAHDTSVRLRSRDLLVIAPASVADIAKR